MTSADLKTITKSAGPNVARAAYLNAAYDLIRSELLPEAPERAAVVLTYSFPSRKVRTVLGQCHYLTKAPKKQKEQHLILIAPRVWVDGELEVLATLAHEMAHAALPPKTKHRAPFAKLVERIGLEGKPTATVPGSRFKEWVKDERSALPTYPGGVVLTFKEKKQTTRLRLWQCECETPIKLRVAKDELDITCNDCGENFVKVKA